MISGNGIKSFLYEESETTLLHLTGFKLTDLECKHVAHTDCERSKLAKELAELVGHKYCILGSHRPQKHTSIEQQICYEKSVIKEMVNCGPTRPIRIVLTEDKRVWSDNNHTTVAHILSRGKEVSIEDVPHYIVDFRGESPVIISINCSVLNSVIDIKSAIASAQRLNIRTKKGYRPEHFTWGISDLFNQLYA
ncbi:hypothetical protein N478_03450 [Pseudoalteromonas luteoviolacea S4060-1]|uniref:Uncharacterized protein n=2 Tax=Pseudoalteromonas luteoviolacea TaxID=43657 RepID=A0A167KUY8_9GAMM|nr:hypothetical protein N478_03450 [Pseudoalteromonas luteoviolacea S4060-1]